MQLVVIAHNIRSTHNVGSIFRTCDGFGVHKLYLTGYTPYPTIAGDKRLPHEREKLTRQIHKTALGAEKSLAFAHEPGIKKLLARLKKDGFYICALEQHSSSIFVDEFYDFFLPKRPPQKVALIVGNEVTGLQDCIASADTILEIRMHGQKESFNVAVAAGIALYALRYGEKV